MNLAQLIAGTNWLQMLLLFSAFALAPAVPAAVLRIKAPALAYKICVTLAVILGLACVLVLALGGEYLLEEHGLLALFAQCLLVSSAPALFCAALVGDGRKIWAALLPAITHFLAIFMRYFIVLGFVQTAAMLSQIEFLFFEGPLAMAFWTSAIFAVWAVVCVYAAKLIYKFACWLAPRFEKKDRRRLDIFGE